MFLSTNEPITVQNQYIEIIRIFFANTSIRGFSRIVKSESTFLRSLWILFVSSTITFLVVSIFKVVIDYRQYSVNIQTYIQIDNATPFPALTFCNHQPFSEQAYRLWENSSVLSPTKFNELVRLSAYKQFKEMLKLNISPTVSEFHHPLFLATMNDRISVYYQNLPTNDSAIIGHNSTIIKNCIWSYGQQQVGLDNQCIDDMLQVKNISHPSYFNCLTVEPRPQYASVISKLGLIIWLGPDEQTNIKHRQGFLLDIFEQAYGLRVVIHEPGSYPNIEGDGVQIEPGRLNELNYQAILNVKVDTERKPCINNPTTIYKDLENEFKYDINLCFNNALQEELIKRCKCIYGNYPRFSYPNRDLPYCGYLEQDKYQDFLKRTICITRFFSGAAEIKSHLKATRKCIHRCTSIEYSTTASVTKWRPTNWQLYWLKEILDAWKKFYQLKLNLSDDPLSTDDLFLYSNLTSRIETFFTRKNLSEFVPDHEKLTFNERYTFLVLKRKANNTFIKEERLVLSFNALVSRIGGLCSLYIGLTFAFFIELIDFLYTIIFLRRAYNPRTRSEKDNSIHKNLNVYSNENNDKRNSEINNNAIPLKDGIVCQGGDYWDNPTKHGSRDIKRYEMDSESIKSNSCLNVSNPWADIDECVENIVVE